MQTALMHCALSAELQLYARAAEKYRYTARVTHSDVCYWNITQCTNGIVTTIFAHDIRISREEEWSIEVGYLPPTVEYIHLHSIYVLRIWVHMCLPRELRYLHLNHCYGVWDDREMSQIDFSRLPPKMEELILLQSTFYRVICFDSLPSTMRFVLIRKMKDDVGFIIVNYPNLPQGLRGLYVTDVEGSEGMEKKVKAIGLPNGVKLSTTYDSNYPAKGSKYFKQFESLLSQIRLIRAI